LADNRLAELSGWDDELLRLEINALESVGFAMDIFGFDDMDEDNSQSDIDYSKKIITPIYTPKGDKPDIKSLVDTSTAEHLILKINESSVDDAEKEFLINAANRHKVFDYHAIAEYYCHSSKEMQELMEQSALVIIDFEKAIENGYVQMSKKLTDIYAETTSEDVSEDE
jgi:hypothetical protein